MTPECVRAVVFHSHGVGQLIKLGQFPEKGETLRSVSWEIGDDGAKGSNTAAAMAMLGIETAFIGSVGADIWAEIGLDWLRRCDVELSQLISRASMRTQVGIVLVNSDGDNSIILGGDTSRFTEDEIVHGIEAFENAELLVTGFEIDAMSAVTIARCAKAHGKYVVFNASPVPKEDFGSLDFADLVIVNELECAQLLKRRGIAPPEAFPSALSALRHSYGCAACILTAGSIGSYLDDGGRILHFPAAETTVVDTSGAGDSYLAAVSAALLRGHALPAACCFATLYAAETVKHAGTFPAFRSLSEMRDLYDEFKLF